MSGEVEIFFIRPGPDGLSRVTVRWLGEGVSRSWVVPSDEAEATVVVEWRELHRRAFGFWPTW